MNSSIRNDAIIKLQVKAETLLEDIQKLKSYHEEEDLEGQVGKVIAEC